MVELLHNAITPTLFKYTLREGIYREHISPWQYFTYKEIYIESMNHSLFCQGAKIIAFAASYINSLHHVFSSPDLSLLISCLKEDLWKSCSTLDIH